MNPLGPEPDVLVVERDLVETVVSLAGIAAAAQRIVNQARIYHVGTSSTAPDGP